MEQKILFTASTYSHIVHFHRPYLRAFAELGYGVDVACGGAPMEIPEARQVIHLPFEKSMTAPDNFRAAGRLRRLMQEEGYTLVSTHTALAAFFTRLAAMGLDTTVVNTCHGYLFDRETPAAKRAVLLAAERLTAGRTDLLLTMNDCDRQIAEDFHLGRRMGSIPGIGVAFSRFDGVTPEMGRQLRQNLGIPLDAFVMVYPAEFSARKRQETLLRAMPPLPTHTVLLLPGGGALLDDCKALARELGVAERVYFPGHVSEMGPWYRAADCAVTSSRSEGLPFNVMEAMYMGLPVVASAVKGHVDLVRDGVNGLLFPWDDASACAGALAALAAEPERRQAMGAAGAAAAEDYRLERVLPQVMDAYRAVLPELPAAAPVT